MDQVKHRVLIDVNVILDTLLDQDPWARAAAELLTLCERGVIEGYWCAASVSTVFYLVRKKRNARVALQAIADLHRILAIAAVDAAVVDQALSSGMADLEDAIVSASAQACGATHVITRDPKGFRNSTVPATDPAALLAALGHLHPR